MAPRGEGVRPRCVGWVLGNGGERMIWGWFSKFGWNGSGKTAAEERVDRPAHNRTKWMRGRVWLQASEQALLIPALAMARSKVR